MSDTVQANTKKDWASINAPGAPLPRWLIAIITLVCSVSIVGVLAASSAWAAVSGHSTAWSIIVWGTVLLGYGVVGIMIFRSERKRKA